MNNFFNKVCINNLKNIFSKTTSLNQINFMKHKIVWLLVPIVALALLISGFVFNCYTNKFDFGAMIDKNKTIIEIPLKDDIDSNTLKKIQKIATKLLKFNCVAQKSIDYDKHINSVLGRDGLNLLQITAFQSNNLTDQQKQLLFDELNMKFSNIVDLQDVNDDINSYTLGNLEINPQFWIQLLVIGSIFLACLIIYSVIRFRKLGIFSICLTATTDLLLSFSLTFLAITLMTKKINLIFMTAMIVYFASNTANLFSNMVKESENEINPSKIANSAILNSIPNALFTIFIAGTASICSLIASVIFNNSLLFYLTVSTLIGIFVNIFINIFFSPQLWALIRNIKTSKKSKLKASTKLPVQN